jgi:hypothetical protein
MRRGKKSIEHAPGVLGDWPKAYRATVSRQFQVERIILKIKRDNPLQISHIGPAGAFEQKVTVLNLPPL